MKKILLIISLLICLSLCLFACNSDKDNDSTDVNNPQNTSTSSVILSESADAGQGYIDKLYFIGDSTTLHFHKGGIDRSHILVPESLTLMLSSDILTIEVMHGNEALTIPEAMAEIKPEILILTLGANGANNFSEGEYKAYYKKLIYAIKEVSPNTEIIIQSVFPVTSDYEAKAISNEGINRLNAWGIQLAEECSLHYLDTQSILKNENGAQIDEYSEGDGIHMNKAAYEKIVEYIRTHALK